MNIMQSHQQIIVLSAGLFTRITSCMAKSPKTTFDITTAGWLVGRLTPPFSTKTGYIGDKVLGGDLVLPG